VGGNSNSGQSKSGKASAKSSGGKAASAKSSGGKAAPAKSSGGKAAPDKGGSFFYWGSRAKEAPAKSSGGKAAPAKSSGGKAAPAKGKGQGQGQGQPERVMPARAMTNRGLRDAQRARRAAGPVARNTRATTARGGGREAPEPVVRSAEPQARGRASGRDGGERKGSGRSGRQGSRNFGSGGRSSPTMKGVTWNGKER
jgi:hypothetical protein